MWSPSASAMEAGVGVVGRYRLRVVEISRVSVEEIVSWRVFAPI
jgi:hypothetical protein